VTTTAPIPAPSVWKVGVVVSVNTETPTARSIMIDVPGWGGNLAGQHLDLRLSAPDGYQAVRSYSVASAGPGERLELAVDRLPDGEVSPYLVDELQVGDELEIRGPLGGWFVWRPEQTGPVQLIGGGSGIVPLMAMARAHAASASTARFKLLYSVRSPHDVFFAEELAGLSSENFEVTWVYTRATPAGWPTPAGGRPPPGAGGGDHTGEREPGGLRLRSDGFRRERGRLAGGARASRGIRKNRTFRRQVSAVSSLQCGY
jgi:ferredoxin-NADP reductase